MITRILLFLLFLPTLAFGQIYGTGVGYVTGTPTHTPNIAQKGSEICISINNKIGYIWNRDSLEWKPFAAMTVTFGAPTAAPGIGETRTAINMQTGLLYWWNGTAWKELIAYSVELASAYASAVAELYANQVRDELADSMVVAREYADSLHLADNDRDSTNELQTPFFDAGSSVLYLFPGTGFTSLAPLVASLVAGSGTPGYIPKWNVGGVSIGDSRIYDSGTNLGIGTASPAYFLDLNSTGAIRLPRGTDAQRPVGAEAVFRYGQTYGPEWYDNVGLWNKVMASSITKGTPANVPHINNSGQLAESGRIRWNGVQTDIYGSTNAYTTATKSFRVLALNGVEMFYVNDNGFAGNSSFSAGNNGFTMGGGTGFPAFNVWSGAGVAELFQHETSGTISFADNSYTNIRVFHSAASFNAAKTMSLWGRLSIGKTTPSYDFDITSTNAYGIPRGTVSQRPTIAASTTPLRYNTDSLALEFGESVGIWDLIATRAYARSLISALPSTNIYTANGTLSGNRTLTGANYSLNLDNISAFNLVSGGVTPASTITSDVYWSQKQYYNQAKTRYFQKYHSTDTRTSTADGNPNFIDIFEVDLGGITGFEWGNATSFDTINAIFYYKFGGRYASSFLKFGGNRPPSGTANILTPLFDFNNNLVGNGTASSPHTSFRIGTDTLLNIKGNGAIEVKKYGNGDMESTDLGFLPPVYIAAFAPADTGQGTFLDLNIDTLAKSEKYYTLTSTSSPQTLSNDFSDNLINQGGTQATFTLNFPASPVDGQILTITYNNNITDLTLDGNGNTIVGSAVITGVPGSQRKFKFYTGIGWIKIY